MKDVGPEARNQLDNNSSMNQNFIVQAWTQASKAVKFMSHTKAKALLRFKENDELMARELGMPQKPMLFRKTNHEFVQWYQKQGGERHSIQEPKT